MDNSTATATATYPSVMKNPYLAKNKQFVRELKVCTLDPARYLQRCIAKATGASSAPTGGSFWTPNYSYNAPNETTFRNIYISKKSFLAEKPDHSTITNMITSRAPGNFYTSLAWPRSDSSYQQQQLGDGNPTNTTSIGQAIKSEESVSPDKALQSMLQSTKVTAKTSTYHSKPKTKKGRKKRYSKTTRSSLDKNVGSSKQNKTDNGPKSKEVKVVKVRDADSKAVTKILLPTVGNAIAKSTQGRSSIINKMLEETLRITFMSNTRCSTNSSAGTIPVDNLLKNSDVFRLVNDFLSNIVHCVKNAKIGENIHDPKNAHTSTSMDKKSNLSLKKLPKTSSKQKELAAVTEGKPGSGHELTTQQKSNFRPKKSRLTSIVLGRPGKDDTEEAELTHCTIQPDPPSAISEPYLDPNSSNKTLLPEEPPEYLTSNLTEGTSSYESNILNPFLETLLDDGSKTKESTHEYNSKITYVRTSTELNLKGVADDASGKDNGHKKQILDDGRNVSTALETSEKKRVGEQKYAIRKSIAKANISESLEGEISKRIIETRKPQADKKVADNRNKPRVTPLVTEKSPALKLNKQVLKKQPERTVVKNSNTNIARRPHTTASDPSRRIRHSHNQRRFPFYRGKENISIAAKAMAERRFFNKYEHLMFLARPHSRYVEDTRQRYQTVLDPHRVRNLNTILYCNHAEDQRLKLQKEDLSFLYFTHKVRRNENRSQYFKDHLIPQHSSEACSTLYSLNSENSNEYNATLTTYEVEDPKNLPTNDMESTLGVIYEESEDEQPGVSRSNVVENSLCLEIVNGPHVQLLQNANVNSNPESSAMISIGLNYRVDRFQKDHDDINEQQTEDEEKAFISEDNQIVSKTSGNYVDYGSKISGDNLIIDLYERVENPFTSILTFSRICEGMDVTLKNMQQLLALNTSDNGSVETGANTLDSSMNSAHSSAYITHEEIRADCSQALLRTKELLQGEKETTLSEKYLDQTNCEQVLGCEICFNDKTLTLETKKCGSHKLDDTEENNDESRHFYIVNFNEVPTFDDVLNHSTTPLQKSTGGAFKGLFNNTKDLNSLIFETEFLKTITELCNTSQASCNSSEEHRIHGADLNRPMNNLIIDRNGQYTSMGNTNCSSEPEKEEIEICSFNHRDPAAFAECERAVQSDNQTLDKNIISISLPIKDITSDMFLGAPSRFHDQCAENFQNVPHCKLSDERVLRGHIKENNPRNTTVYEQMFHPGNISPEKYMAYKEIPEKGVREPTKLEVFFQNMHTQDCVKFSSENILNNGTNTCVSVIEDYSINSDKTDQIVPQEVPKKETVDNNSIWNSVVDPANFHSEFLLHTGSAQERLHESYADNSSEGHVKSTGNKIVSIGDSEIFCVKASKEEPTSPIRLLEHLVMSEYGYWFQREFNGTPAYASDAHTNDTQELFCESCSTEMVYTIPETETVYQNCFRKSNTEPIILEEDHGIHSTLKPSCQSFLQEADIDTLSNTNSVSKNHVSDNYPILSDELQENMIQPSLGKNTSGADCAKRFEGKNFGNFDQKFHLFNSNTNNVIIKCNAERNSVTDIKYAPFYEHLSTVPENQIMLQIQLGANVSQPIIPSTTDCFKGEYVGKLLHMYDIDTKNNLENVFRYVPENIVKDIAQLERMSCTAPHAQEQKTNLEDQVRSSTVFGVPHWFQGEYPGSVYESSENVSTTNKCIANYTDCSPTELLSSNTVGLNSIILHAILSNSISRPLIPKAADWILEDLAQSYASHPIISNKYRGYVSTREERVPKLVGKPKETFSCESVVAKTTVVLQNFFKAPKGGGCNSKRTLRGKDIPIKSIARMLEAGCFSDCADVGTMVSTSAEVSNEGQNCKPMERVFNIKLQNDSKGAATWHEITVLDCSSSLISSVHKPLSKPHEHRNSEQCACSSKDMPYLTPFGEPENHSKLIQNETMDKDKEKCSDTKALEISTVPPDVSSSGQRTLITKATVVLVVLSFSIALCATALLPSTPTVSPAIKRLIYKYLQL